ncbi:MAG: hypothetical protein AVDCRST_MAG48-1990, partial [uncultured Friedmanniella sp.]
WLQRVTDPPAPDVAPRCAVGDGWPHSPSPCWCWRSASPSRGRRGGAASARSWADAWSARPRTSSRSRPRGPPTSAAAPPARCWTGG